MRAAGSVHPSWGAAEIAALAGLFALTVWGLAPHVGSPATILAMWGLLLAAGALLFWISPVILHHDPPGVRGWGFFGRARTDPGALGRAWTAYALYTFAGAAVIVGLALARDGEVLAHVDAGSVALKFAGYLVWGLVQAAAVYGFLQTRLRSVMGLGEEAPYGARALGMSLILAGLFAAAHLPNLPLAGLVFAAGLGWSRLYYSRPNLLLLALSHAVLGTLVHRVLQISTRVGPFYAHPEWHVMQALIPGLRAVFGNLF